MDHFFYFLLQVNHCIVLVNCSCHKWKQTSPKMDSARSLEARLIWANIWPTSANRLITLNSTQPRRTSKVATVAMSMYLSLRTTTCSTWAWRSLINLRFLSYLRPRNLERLLNQDKPRPLTRWDNSLHFAVSWLSVWTKAISSENLWRSQSPSCRCFHNWSLRQWTAAENKSSINIKFWLDMT